MTTQPPPQMLSGIVKQVNSGDTIVLRGPPKNGPPSNMTVVLTGINAPKLARRPDNQGENAKKDMPYAWEAREFLRKKLIGKRVWFTCEKGKQTTEPKNPKQLREYGIVYVGPDPSSENVAETLVSEGLVEVRTQARNNEYVQKLEELQNVAKAAGKGIHGSDKDDHVRDIRWNIENLHNFKDSLHQKPIKAIIEHVVDGSTMRALLFSDEFPEYYYVKLMLSGIRCNGFNDQGAEPYAEEAKYFTECRLLQRDVEVLLESVSNKNFLGTVLHPNGNITELLLKEGFAKCVDWSLQCVSCGIEKLRSAEKVAKEKHLRIWKDYVPNLPLIDAKEKEFQAKVIEVINADAMIVKLADGSTKKIFLASLRPPRMPESADTAKPKIRALYDIPYMFEAREFLRKKLIGKKVNVVIDYKQPANNNYPEKVCCTVTIGGINVAEALVSKGFATVARYRADDDHRSAHYDDLLSAETKAVKSGKGLHSKKDPPIHRIVDLAGDLKSSKQYFPIIQRAGKMEAIVEFVASGSRLRVYLPRQSYLLTFLLGGINCQKASRDNGLQPGDPFGDDALAFTKDLCLQNEVQIEVESMDKAGNFIGWMWVDGQNLSEVLVREGFADVHPTAAARSPYSRALATAREEAQKKKLKMWICWAPVETEIKEEPKERVVKHIKVNVLHEREEPTTKELFFTVHLTEDVPKFDDMMLQLQEEMACNPPLEGSFHPKKGDLIAATYAIDHKWHRCRVLKIYQQDSGAVVHLLQYVDLGLKVHMVSESMGPLPPHFASITPFAKEYCLPFVRLPDDLDMCKDAEDEFARETIRLLSVWLNLEYTIGGVNYATLYSLDTKADIGKMLVENGFILATKRTEKRFQKMLSEYQAAQESAKKNRLNLWMYGDITEDDAKEFG